MLVYGPVPSRRLGRSLGVNHVPPKTCSYSCVYCQLGRTDNMILDRRRFYDPGAIVEQVRERLDAVGDEIDYVTFVPDGEPTLDVNLGSMIEAVNGMGAKTAVIGNASLLWMEEVRSDLMEADWVSVKVDAVTEETWRRVDRPHGGLNHGKVLDGVRAFAGEYGGTLATETMLVEGFNDGDEPSYVAEFLRELDADVSYVAIPTRPPAEASIKPAGEEAVNRTYQVFSGVLGSVEYLIGYEGNAFASSGDFEADLLSITSVHPMREEAVEALLRRDGSEWGEVERLIGEDKLVELEYMGNRFYMRRISSRSR
jgi:wyosine [tRNA(Phe)-imidazoG37] synthetase (radical SAM superfamily)